MKELRIISILLILLLIAVFIFFVISCKKSKTENPSSGNIVNYYTVSAKVLRVKFCDKKPVLLEFTEGGWYNMFSFPYGFNYENEYWSFDLPDSLKASGQELELFFRPRLEKYWKECDRIIPPNQIEIVSVKARLDWSEIEVVGIAAGCGKAIVRINPSFKYTYGTNVIAVNLPDNLKVLGKKLICDFRYASVDEQRECYANTSWKQVIVNNIFIW